MVRDREWVDEDNTGEYVLDEDKFDRYAQDDDGNVWNLGGGLCATVNSDDPAYFGGYINDNFVQAVGALSARGARQAYQLAANSFEASFADAASKVSWLRQLDAAFAAAARQG